MLKLLLAVLIVIAISATVLLFVERLDAALLALIANFIVFAGVMASTRILGTVKTVDTVPWRSMYMLYALLAMAALASTVLHGIEYVWAVYGVGSVLGLLAILRTGQKPSIRGLGWLLGLPLMFLAASLWFRWPILYIGPAVILGVGVYASLGHRLWLPLSIGSLVAYIGLLFIAMQSPFFSLSVAVTATTQNLEDLVAKLASLLLLFTIVGVAEELSSRALIPVVGAGVTSAVFVLLHVPSRFYGLLVPILQRYSDLATMSLASVLYVSAMMYLILPTLVLVWAYRSYGLVAAMLLHTLFDALVSIGDQGTVIATLLVATIASALARR